MAAPGREIYLADGFQAVTLTMPQLRSILLEHGVPTRTLARKADLVLLFETQVKPRAAALLASQSNIQPSAQGVIAVANDGSESLVEEPVKKRPGRPRKTATRSASAAPVDAPKPRTSDASENSMIIVDSAPAPVEEPAAPAKRGPGRPRKSALPPAPVPAPPSPSNDPLELMDEDAPPPPPEPVKKPRGRPRKSATPAEPAPVPAPAPVFPPGVAQVHVELPSPAKRSRKGKAKAAEMDDDDEDDFMATQKVAPRRSLAAPSPASIAHASAQLQPSSSPAPSPAIPRIKFDDLPTEAEVAAELRRREQKERRRSKAGLSGDESGFSDSNPFQSGSEAAAKRERRRSSMGAPKPKRAARPSDLAFAASTSTASPASILRRVGPSSENLRAPPADVRVSLRREFGIDEAEQHNQVVSAKLNQLQKTDEPVVRVSQEQQLVKPSSAALLRRAVPSSATRSVPLALLAMLLLPFLSNYKSQSASIGFCDSHAATNNVLTSRAAAVDAAQSCVHRRAEQMLNHPGASHIECDVSALPLVPFAPRPTACAPCPPHAQCANGEIVACDSEYILAPHPLEILSPALDGLPGVGPRAFAPSCRPDTVRKRHVGLIAREVESHLARKRGEAVCAGVDDAKVDGVRLGEKTADLRDALAARRDAKFSRGEFDAVFAAAVEDLLAHGDVLSASDTEGTEWIAAARADMTLACRAKREALNLADSWKKELGGTLAVLAAIAALSSKQKHVKQEKYEAAELVDVVLRRLQDQERLHYTDPVTAPTPFLAPAQLRDLVLPHAAATSSKDRLWRRVSAAVAQNANVRVSEEENAGENWETWTWTGPRAQIE